MDENMLRELFQTFGSLKSLSMMRGPDGNSKGYGFCEYNDTSVTDSAIAALNNVTLFNRSITVSRAKKPAVEQPIAVTLPTPSALLAMSQGVVKPSTLPLPSSILTHQFQGDALALQQFNQLSQKTTLTAGIHGPRGEPSAVVCFENMVSADELSTDAEYTDILDDIRDEGSKFGPLRVAVPRPPHPSAGRVFLYYEDISNAIKAAHALSGRKFGPNIVTSKYYPEKEFREGNLTA
jgi:splicing factor U2AF subunit